MVCFVALSETAALMLVLKIKFQFIYFTSKSAICVRFLLNYDGQDDVLKTENRRKQKETGRLTIVTIK